MERIERQAEESQTNTPHDHEQNQHKPSTIGTKQHKTAENSTKQKLQLTTRVATFSYFLHFMGPDWSHGMEC